MKNADLHPVLFDHGALQLIDQRALPAHEVWISITDPSDVAAAIRDMIVRGAPAIGVAAGYGMALAASKAASMPSAEIRAYLDQSENLLRSARPTAVNLAWAVERVRRAIDRDPKEIAAAALREANAIFREDVEACHAIGRNGAELLAGEVRVLTHCNAGALATAGYGTALGVVRAARDAGKKIRVIATETRPYLQGARLTAWELSRDGIDVTLITDGMAGHLMQRGEIDVVVVGADRIAANGDVANKIGTYTLAVLAREHALPFYVAAPTSTIDRSVADGLGIPIEERSSDEVVAIGGHRVAPEGVKARHPAFDMTPARLVTAIVTERGVARAPYTHTLATFFE
jgi:methylthioribose-1-phosphate isomerase